MKVRTFLILVAGFAGVTVLAVAVLNNLPVLEQPFQLTAGRSIPLYGILVGAFVLGLGLSVLIGILQDSRSLYERLQSWWGARTRRAIEKFYRQGMEALLGGDDERALAAFDKVLAQRPDHFEALMVSGDALRGLRRFDQAVERHRRARRLRPEDLAPLYSLANDYEESRQLAQARLALNKIIAIEPRKSIAALRRLRKIDMKDGNWKGALEQQERIEALIEKTPYKVEAERRYGLGIRYQLALQQAEEGNLREAIAGFHKVLKMAPDFVPALLALGDVQREGGDPDAAVETWREGFRKTQSPVFLTMLEEFFLEMEDPQVAIDTFRRLIHDSEHDALPRFFLGKLYLRLEMIDEAHRELDRLRRKVSRSPALHYYLGKVLARRRDLGGAVREFEAALDQVDLLRLQYVCSVCAAKHRQWLDRCDTCGEWNTVKIDLPEDRPAEETDISPTPVYSV
jgi:lipopolysaccharide biosynthesis regulator YciM